MFCFNPFLIDNYSFEKKIGHRKFTTPPLSLVIIASLTPEDVEVRVVDENIESVDFDEEADLVGITITSFTALRGYEIADVFRRRGVKVILGGLQVTLMPEESLRHADSICVGEVEDLWRGIISDFRFNKLKKVYWSKKRPSLKNKPMPRWDLIKNDKYICAPLLPTRGCPYNCGYCVANLQFGRKLRKRPISLIIQEIKYLKRFYTHFWFIDHNLFADKDYIKDLLKKIEPLKIRFSCFANVDLHEDDELLELLNESGCEHIFVGFETLDEKNLETINKYPVNKVQEYPLAIKKIQEKGIFVRALFLLGLQYDNQGTLKKIKDFVINNNILFVDIFSVKAYPKTDYYLKLEKMGRLSPNFKRKKEYLNSTYPSYTFRDTAFDFIKLIKQKTVLNNELYNNKSFFERTKNFNKAYPHFWDRFYIQKTTPEDGFKAQLRILTKKIFLTIKSMGDIGELFFTLRTLWHPDSFYKGKGVYQFENHVFQAKIYKEWQVLHMNFDINFRLIYALLVHPESYKDIKMLKKWVEYCNKVKNRKRFISCKNKKIKNRLLFLMDIIKIKKEAKKYMKSPIHDNPTLTTQ